MKNLLLKKSFLRLSLFVLVFGFIFSACTPGGGAYGAFIFYLDNGSIAQTLILSENETINGTTRTYKPDADKKGKINKAYFELSMNNIQNLYAKATLNPSGITLYPNEKPLRTLSNYQAIESFEIILAPQRKP